jgi:protein-S-isoprenylcysteine O-methyltransferase Ste14
MLTMPALLLWSLQVALTAFGSSLLPAPLFWNSPLMQVVGLILCVAGLIVFVLALISFGDAWRIGVDEVHSDRLVTRGIFAVSRNPIFVFMNLYFAGTFLMFPNWFFLLFFILMALGIHRQILNEEKYLLSKFGVEYEKYMNKVRRYL